jgi:hypothetical protein
VADVLHGGPVRHILGVGQLERVEVGPQGDDRTAAGADVTREAVALGEHPRLEAGGLELLGHQRGGVELAAGRLGMRVDVAAQRDELGAARGEPSVQLTR